MHQTPPRIQIYEKISNTLARLTDGELEKLLAAAKPLSKSIGGTASSIFIEDIPIFVKKIPLTDLEQSPQHLMSTANLFELPLFYQYGVGSTGFGVWRELSAHILTTNSVIAGECLNFPLLYHWRILPRNNHDEEKKSDDICRYWENSKAIRHRLESLDNATMCVTLFLEYVPQTLFSWLNVAIQKGGSAAEKAIYWTERELKATGAFMKTKDFRHFDAHFHNLLTDGKHLYFSDFGLALSSSFNLSKEEKDFLNYHHNYDEACFVVNLLHCIVTSLFGKEKWPIDLCEIIALDLGDRLPPGIIPLIKKYMPIALMMDDFFYKLRKESKLTPYPMAKIQELFDAL